MKQVLAITRKELDSYFGSPMALIFVGIFLLTVHFSFFWLSGFFARGIADVRPLFQSMPLLLIFLISTLTMRQWSEEQQTGTLEMLLTMPVKLWQLVLGKFLAVLALVCVALALTLSLPITAALTGNLDPGPVVGGYLAAILMASAYIAIGLFISSRTDNQIVALLLTAIVCGMFYLIGAPFITNSTNFMITEVLRALGTSSHFESIERGVIDLRDLLYYGSLTAIFLTLNILSLDSKRWSKGLRLKEYRFNRRLMTALILINVIILNIWMFRGGATRLDLTQNGQYTLSPVTRELLSNLQEPLLIRGYFSEDTHPLLAPLLPSVRDTLQEYKLVANDKLQIDFVDPVKNPEIEQEASQLYGIRPRPLQMQDRGKTSVVNAYLDILIRYGDQSEVMNLLDMIDVQAPPTGGTPDVRLRNLEYDLTSHIQRVVYGFQSLDAVVAGLKEPATLTLYYTPNTLPEELKAAPNTISTVANNIIKQVGDKFAFKTIDMSLPNSGVSAQTLETQYQIQPISSGLLSQDVFYLHMVVEADGKSQVIYPTGGMSETEIRTSIESALKRSSTGSLRVVGIWTPAPAQDQFGQQQQSSQTFSAIQQILSENYDVRSANLSSGQVPNDFDVLVVVAPQNLTDTERYAIDQFLMRGGSVFVAAGNYQIGFGQVGLEINPIQGSLKDMLAAYGVNVDLKLVMDKQNSPFPVQTQRDLGGGVVVNEIQPVNYPYFIDVRNNAMDKDSAVVARLPGVTLNWASPVTVDAEKTKNLKVTHLMKSSQNAWLTEQTIAIPDFNLYPEDGFAVTGVTGVHTLAVALEGSFTSFFQGKTLPTLPSANQNTSTDPSQPAPTTQPANANFVAESPNTARLVVVGSGEFLNDNILNLSRQLGSETAVNNLQLVQNSVEWFVEDTALSTIRAKGTGTRILNPLTERERTLWEVFNYAFALISLIILGVIWQLRRRSEKPIRLTAAPSQDVQPVQAPQGGV